MLEEPEPKDPDLIDRREYGKRRRAFFKKHGQTVQEWMKLNYENKISWGMILERNAEQYSNNIAIIFEDTKLTYKEFNEWINQYANYFLSLGLKKGDIVEAMITNRPEILTILFAASKIGAITSLINTDLREKSLEHCLKLTPGKVIIIDEGCFESFNNVKLKLNLSEDQKLFFLPDQGNLPCPEGFIDITQEIRNFSIHKPSSTEEIKTLDPIAYLFTSGTTGFPKAAMINHSIFIQIYYGFGVMMAELTPEDIMYASLPLFHGTGLYMGCLAPLGCGAAVVIGRRFSTSRFWDEIRKYNATAFPYVGEVCRYLMNQPLKPNDAQNSVRVVIGNGLRPEIWMDFKERFNITRIGEFYGAVDGNGAFNNILNFDRTVGTCSTSYAIVNYDIEGDNPIRGEDGFMQKVDVGEAGLCLFQSAGAMESRGYTDEKATEAKLFRNVFKEGDVWFNSGDLLRDLGCDHAQFIDRLGDTYRWKGHNVSTTEVEEVLNVFEQTLFSTVYGIQIPNTDGRAGMAAIVPTVSLEDFNLKELALSFTKNLPSYAVPIFLRIKSKLATTATFKLKKGKLKNEGFDLEKIEDPMYIMLPQESEYVSLTKEIYQNIQNGQYKF